jgi:hypothetical protein
VESVSVQMLGCLRTCENDRSCTVVFGLSPILRKRKLQSRFSWGTLLWCSEEATLVFHELTDSRWY